MLNDLFKEGVALAVRFMAIGVTGRLITDGVVAGLENMGVLGGLTSRLMEARSADTQSSRSLPVPCT